MLECPGVEYAPGAENQIMDKSKRGDDDGDAQ